MRRFFTAPPADLRCVATARNLRGGETAQCMRRRDESYTRNPPFCCNNCAQHARMVLQGKEVRNHHTGEVITLMKESR